MTSTFRVHKTNTKNISILFIFGKKLFHIGMMTKRYLTREAKAWLKRNGEPGELVTVMPTISKNRGQCYELYTAFAHSSDYLGRILFDEEGYWIYDGNDLSVTEQEQVAQFIIGQAARA
jgi:hypothetical protein